MLAARTLGCGERAVEVTEHPAELGQAREHRDGAGRVVRREVRGRAAQELLGLLGRVPGDEELGRFERSRRELVAVLGAFAGEDGRDGRARDRRRAGGGTGPEQLVHAIEEASRSRVDRGGRLFAAQVGGQLVHAQGAHGDASRSLVRAQRCERRPLHGGRAAHEERPGERTADRHLVEHPSDQRGRLAVEVLQRFDDDDRRFHVVERREQPGHGLEQARAPLGQALPRPAARWCARTRAHGIPRRSRARDRGARSACGAARAVARSSPRRARGGGPAPRVRGGRGRALAPPAGGAPPPCRRLPDRRAARAERRCGPRGGAPRAPRASLRRAAAVRSSRMRIARIPEQQRRHQPKLAR